MRNEQEWKDALHNLPKHQFKWVVSKFNKKELKIWEANNRLLDEAIRRLKELFVSSVGARSITSLPALTGSTFAFEYDVDSFSSGNVAITNGEVTFVATAPTLITMKVAKCNGHTWQDWMRVAKDIAESLDTDVVIK